MPQDSTQNFEKEMATQMAGFQLLGRVRKFFYQAALVAAVIYGAREGSLNGPKDGVVAAFLVVVFGLGGIRLLSAPIGVYLWYRHWVCPGCKKRLGTHVIEDCPHCGAHLFTHAKN